MRQERRPVASATGFCVMDDFADVDLLALDYDTKVKMLERCVKELLDLRVEFAQVSGRYAELRANITVLKEVKSALQSAIRAEK